MTTQDKGHILPLPSRYDAGISLTLMNGPLPKGSGSGGLDTIQPLRDLQIYAVPIRLCCFWPDNHNSMDEMTFQAELESMLMHDFFDPVMLRPFDEADLSAGLVRPEDLEPGVNPADCYEMIDGEHRTRGIASFIEHGLPGGQEPPPLLRYLVENMAVAAVIRPMSRSWAQRVRLAISEIRGKKDYRKLGRLVVSLAENISPEELRHGTPWSVDQVKELLAVGQFDWDKFVSDKHAAEEQTAGEFDRLFKGQVECPATHREAVLRELVALQERYGLRFKEAKSSGKGKKAAPGGAKKK